MHSENCLPTRWNARQYTLLISGDLVRLLNAKAKIRTGRDKFNLNATMRSELTEETRSGEKPVTPVQSRRGFGYGRRAMIASAKRAVLEGTISRYREGSISSISMM